MARHLAFGGTAKPLGRSLTCMASLAFVILLGAAFWAGAVWLGQILLRLGAGG